MFSPEVQASIPTFKAKKQAQWERVKDQIHGLQHAVTGETEFSLTCSTHDGAFYESIIYGQLPQVHLEAYGNPNRPKYRDVPEAKKPFEKRAIDLSDAQIDLVLALWDKQQSAFALDFIAAVWGPGGKRHLKA